MASTESLHFLSCSARFSWVNILWPAAEFSATFSFKAYRTDNEMALQYLTILGKKVAVSNDGADWPSQQDADVWLSS